MNAYYTLKNGERIFAFVHEDYYPGKTLYHHIIEVTEIDMTSSGTDGYTYRTRKSIKYPGEMEACTHERSVYEDDDTGEKYFNWKGHRVNILDWDYHCIPILCEEIEYAKSINDRWFVPRDIGLASLMKQSDKFAVLVQPRVIVARLPGTTLSMMSDPVEEYIPYIPYYPSMREKERWYYKIALWPKDENLRSYCGSEEYYFDDFWSLLFSGHLKLVEL